MKYLPGATLKLYGTSGGSWTDTRHPKGVLHTTEGPDWTSYDSGQKAPHISVKAIPGKGVQVRQHIPFTTSARALRNEDGGVQTNRDYAFQIELIGTCDPKNKKKMFYWPEADDAVLRDLYVKVIEPMSRGLHIPLLAPAFQAYPASYGAKSGSNNVRMSGSAWDVFTGWCGHQHVPENSHGDPGAFPWARMLAVRPKPPAPKPAPKPPAPAPAPPKAPSVVARVLTRLRVRPKPASRPIPIKMPRTLRRGDTGEDVKKLQRLLGVTADGIFGPATEAHVRRLQQTKRLAADGVVGPQTWAALGVTRA